MSNDQCATVILARGGSKGVPGKNLKPVGGVSLIGRAVRAGIAAQSQSAVYVSTDDPSIAAEARLHGAQVIDRPADLADDSASSEAGWLHALAIVKSELPDLKSLVFLQCTSPFITGSDIDACFDAMIASDAVCSLSVVEDHSFLWGLDESGLGVGQNHDHTKQRKRRQDLPPQYRENGAIYCVNVDAFSRAGQRFCGPVAICPVSQPPLEIDSVADLDLAQLIASNTDSAAPSPALLRRVKVLVMDFDGVHTDNLVMTDQDGRETVRTSRSDGMGLAELARRTSIKRLIVSKERNPVVLARADKLAIEVSAAVDDKVAMLNQWLANEGLMWDQMLYVGNDINDLSAMFKAGIAACPNDSHKDVFAFADWVVPFPGGHGALRYLCDNLIRAHDTK